MATAKIVTANGVSRLEIKKGFGKLFILEGDEFQEFAEYLQDEHNLSKQSTIIQNSDGAKTTLNNKELRSLAEKLKSLRKPLESPTEAINPMANEIVPPEPLKPVAGTKRPVVHKPEPIQASKLQVISILFAAVEWTAYATCPNCKTRHCLDITQGDGTNQSQFATQCDCGQILFLQK